MAISEKFLWTAVKILYVSKIYMAGALILCVLYYLVFHISFDYNIHR